MTTFLEALWGSFPRTGRGRFGEIRRLRGGVSRQEFYAIGETGYKGRLEEEPKTWDFEGWDVFFGVLPRVVVGGSADDCEPNVHVLWADVDAKTHDASKAAALFALGEASLTPSILVDSGNGWHAYWLLRQGVPFNVAQLAMRGLAKAVGGDHVYDAPRILRLPDTHNHKSDPPKPVRILYFAPDRRYRFSDFYDFMEEERLYRPRETVVSEWEPSGEAAPKFPEGRRNVELTRLAGIMVAKDLNDDELLDCLMAENEIRCDPPLPEHEVESIARSVRRYR